MTFWWQWEQQCLKPCQHKKKSTYKYTCQSCTMLSSLLITHIRHNNSWKNLHFTASNINTPTFYYCEFSITENKLNFLKLAMETRTRDDLTAKPRPMLQLDRKKKKKRSLYGNLINIFHLLPLLVLFYKMVTCVLGREPEDRRSLQ